ncbi:hypothetical protein [Pseudomonas fragariae (ex Marin et al. 2024)]|uniref:Uncharacterized protein n=2 Tax=Pseudomonas fragariae (ex Marin et al. 2024) TaxID=3080056 RepID=A0ABU5AZW2_9PSED|nr:MULTISPECIES: hypothetical protein [unclassified Pseudomonas]MCW6054182.1 hypothetical protein [Pseudomonas fragi]MDV0424247.1 hypothetical protein [Pseudomonas sp. 17]MDX9570839.1 hypothetical protein [Pseudomonas sp. 21(2023)]MDX9584722.1 hypothetical protein [Pseudomonas sp. 19(2023)]MDX9626685.1 hypothetical protein [Pseudomonas sp. 20]
MKTEEINFKMTWARCVDAQENVVRGQQRALESYDSRAASLAFGPYKLECFLERLKARYYSPWLELDGIEAAKIYLINKHHWLPGAVRDVQKADLLLILHEELVELCLSKEEFSPVQDWSQLQECYPKLLKSANIPE